jgi:hypothetical protein
MKSLACCIWLLLLHPLPAATVKDREAAVRADRASLQNQARWIYSDFERGFREARRTGKPLLVVLRCVPCLGCAGIDSAVLSQETGLTALLDQFVCVRVIDANALDLARFQFDYDLSFSTLFFNGDGTVYGRYGSWRHQKDPEDKTIEGYKRALEGALAIHGNYPANKKALSGKQGAPVGFKTPVDIPLLAAKFKPQLDWEGKVVGSCVHCHQIGDALRQDLRDKNQPLPSRLIYPWPTPESVGLVLASDRAARVESVLENSPAAQAGLKAGDELLSLAGQPLISIADVSWVLHHAADSDSLPARIKTAAGEKEIQLVLAEGWRKKNDISRRETAWSLRGMGLGGLGLTDLTDEARRERGLSSTQMALLVKYVGQFGKHAAAKNAGFLKDDVIVELEGKAQRISESELLGDLLQQHRPGESVRAMVLRENQRLELSLPIQ